MGGIFRINVCLLPKKKKLKWTNKRQNGVWQRIDS